MDGLSAPNMAMETLGMTNALDILTHQQPITRCIFECFEHVTCGIKIVKFRPKTAPGWSCSWAA